MREHFRWLKGEEKLSSFESSPGKSRYFCSGCGSHLTAEVFHLLYEFKSIVTAISATFVLLMGIGDEAVARGGGGGSGFSRSGAASSGSF